MAATQRHPKYWFLDGNIVFQVNGTLFHLHQGVLFVPFTYSGEYLYPSIWCWQMMVSDEDHPIVLPGISGEEFEHFISWLYHQWNCSHDRNLPLLWQVLKVSRLWQIDNSISWAIAHLDQLELSAVHKLSLQQYMIPQWIAPSVRSLTLASLSAIDEDEALVLGVRVYSIIARAREVMETERHPIAAVSPGLSVPPSPACNISHHAHCKVVWTCFWWQKVARQLLHPYNPLAISALVEYVAQQANPDSLNLECKASFVNQVVESGGLEVEENIIYGAITAVEAYFNTLYTT
ncbi:hypothetical protein EDC04DRAFT_2586389 [Pisolithus marmoratus]|nr:hypothetical protein EDC04DRAFT_2586389 [Pisolithus marmoratus]